MTKTGFAYKGGKQGRQQQEVVDWSSLHRVLTFKRQFSAISCLNCHPLISIWPSHPKAERTDLVARTRHQLCRRLACTHSYNECNSQRINMESHTTPPYAQLHTIGGNNNRRIVRNKASPSTSCRIELMLTISIFGAGQRCSNVMYLLVRILQPL